ncbi:unnamed protein product [Protopolystoma xenopodis]|uniref:Uncharacterized protein n=1 Tax=Protopolystoma xenopodis TaxID=117903 RepID=A0A3S5AHB3_9PLAT|nr:unnamed protein product [Protopolystoma xenopodis]
MHDVTCLLPFPLAKHAIACNWVEIFPDPCRPISWFYPVRDEGSAELGTWLLRAGLRLGESWFPVDWANPDEKISKPRPRGNIHGCAQSTEARQ